MSKRILFLILPLLITSCNSQNISNYAEKLSDCLSESDIELLNKATYIFELKLADYYGNKDSKQNFIAYINDLGSIPPTLKSSEFYYNDETVEIIKELKQNKTFEKIWLDYEEDDSQEEDIEIAQLEGIEEPEIEELKLTILNPNGEFLDCVNSNYQNPTVKKVLAAQAEYGNIASSILAGVLKKQLTEKDFENGLNKLIVAITLYYDMTNLIENNPN